jgi:hypothetical protein
MVPEYWTAPVGERSRWLSIVIHGLGPITPESSTPLGTVLIIFSKIVKQVSSKDCGEDMAWIVAFPSEENIRKSDRKV